MTRSAALSLAVFPLGLWSWGLAGGSTLAAQELPDTVRVSIVGRIVDGSTGEPLRGALVHVRELGFTTFTDPTGDFRLDTVPRGTYAMTVTLGGYRMAQGEFTISQSGSFVLPLWRSDLSPSTAASRVLGRVLDRESGSPLIGALLRLSGLGASRISDSEGRFEFGEIVPGHYVLTVEYLGYGTREDSLFIPPDRTLTLDVRLGVEPIALEGITVEVEARSRWLELEGLYGRKEEGTGRQWTVEDIRERNPHYLTDLVQLVPGLNVARDGFRTTVLSRRRVSLNSGSCALPVYVDGFPVPDFNLDGLDPSTVEALEVYHGIVETPIQYQNHCGVILVWLKH